MRNSIKFLHDFRFDIVKSIDKNKKSEHIEYIPSQVATEYFKHFLKIENKPIDGILYPSQRADGGKCCILFIDQCNIIDNEEKLFDKSTLLLKEVVNSIRE